jgi:hypothetical protein
MADAVTSQKIVDTDRKLVYKFTNISDGTGEDAVKKVDVSALNTNDQGETCTRVTLTQLWYDIGGIRVSLEWDATSNVVCTVLGGSAAAGVVSGHAAAWGWSQDMLPRRGGLRTRCRVEVVPGHAAPAGVISGHAVA